jgi:hypothetical protein
MQQVSACVGNKNRPCGGVDKFCRIEVHLIGAPVALIEDVGADLYAVIDRDARRYRHEIQKPIHAHGDIK